MTGESNDTGASVATSPGYTFVRSPGISKDAPVVCLETRAAHIPKAELEYLQELHAFSFDCPNHCLYRACASWLDLHRFLQTKLPTSCYASAACLRRDRARYEEGNVFPSGLVDALAKNLQDYDDLNLSERLYGNADALRDMVNKFQHCG